MQIKGQRRCERRGEGRGESIVGKQLLLEHIINAYTNIVVAVVVWFEFNKLVRKSFKLEGRYMYMY